MAQEQIQEQQQTLALRQTQSITQQQLLQAQLIELPITQLIERVNTEMDDNPALEFNTGDDSDYSEFSEDSEYSENSESSDDYEKDERQSALDAALENIGRDDEELPVYQGGQDYHEEREEMVYGASQSFYDQLKEQMGVIDLDERQRDIMEYLIGSLDDDGLLRKSLDSISDELAIYHAIDATPQEIESVLHYLQEFDPAGIGGRSLQECLTLQIQRRQPSHLRDLMLKVVQDYFETFTKKHWKKIQQALGLTDLQADALMKELRKLNPKPGASLGETVGRAMQQITPDFIVDTQALLYTKKKVDAAMGFIEAIRTRRQTLTMTMRAIIQWQHRYFEEGDEALLRPMILKDIAEKTGLDLSTISRVSNSKYAQTRWGTFPLRHFFSDSYVTAEGDELSTREIKATLRDLVDAEDKQKPLSDEALGKLLAEKGYPIARRTVAKYREQLGIPIARLRK